MKTLWKKIIAYCLVVAMIATMNMSTFMTVSALETETPSPAAVEEETMQAEEEEELPPEEETEMPEEDTGEVEEELEEETGTNGTCGDNLTWSIGSDGTLIISGEGVMEDYDFRTYPAPWSDYKSIIERVVIEEGITYIGDHSFMDCTNLTEVTIPQGVKIIGVCAFQNTSLTEVEIPYGVTAILDQAFLGCSDLAKVTLPDTLVRIGEFAFYQCGALKQITLPDSLTTIDTSAFEDSGLTEITIPASVTAMEDYIFNNCNSLEKVTLQEGLSVLGEKMFSGCISLTEITFPESVASVPVNVIDSCGKLTDVIFMNSKCNIPADFVMEPYGSSAIIHGYLGSTADKFAENRQFEFVPLMSGTAGENISWKIEGDTLTISGNGPMGDYRTAKWISYDAYINKVIIEDGVTSIGPYAFDNMEFTEIEIPESVTSIERYAFNCCWKLERVNLPEGLISIDEGGFYNCESLKEIDLPDTLTTIGEYAFQESGLTEISIPASVTNMAEYAFYICENLNKIVLEEGFDALALYMFGGCSSVKEISFPKSVTSIPSLGGAFKPEKIYIYNPSCVISGLALSENGEIYGYKGSTAESYAEDKSYTFKILFYGTQGENITWKIDNNALIISGNGPMGDCALASWHNYGNYVTSVVIEEGVTSIGDYAFHGWNNLKGTLTIPESVTSIGDYAFAECAGFTGDLVIPDSVTEIGTKAFHYCENIDGKLVLSKNLTRIENQAFQYCKKLSGELVIPEKVTSIGTGAFLDCNFEGTVVLHEGITSVDEYAFYQCDNIEKMYILNTECDLNGSMSNSEMTIYGYADSTAQSYAESKALTFVALDVESCEHPESCNETIPKVDSTCDTAGKAEYVQCGICEKVLSGGEELPLAEHKWEETYTVDKDATCSEEGLKSIHCSVCDATKEETVIPVLSHNYSEWIVDKEATCLDEGKKHKECANCDAEEKGTIKAKGHKEEIDAAVPPTCTETGFTEGSHCTVCGEVTVAQEEIPATGHSFGEWTIHKKAEFGIIGSERQYCTNECGKYNEREYEIVDSGTCGDSATWTIDYRGRLVISGTGAITDGNGFSKYNCDYSAIVIEEGITEIGDYIFANTPAKVTELQLADTIVNIGNYAFAGPSNFEIENLKLPEQLEYIGTGAFCGLEDLTGELVIPAMIKYIYGSAFEGCTGLTSLQLPENVQMDMATFKDCTGLTGELVIPEGAFIRERSFMGCTGLTSIKFPENKMTQEHAATFGGCTGLTGDIVLPEWYEYLGSEFDDCINIEHIIVRNTQIKPLRVVSIPENVCLVVAEGSDIQVYAEEHGMLYKTFCEYYGHEYGPWTSNQQIDFGTIGIEERVCEVCGEKEYREFTEIAAGTCGSSARWSVDYQGTLTITGTGAITNKSGYTMYSENIKKIIIGEGITEIGENAFYEVAVSESIEFPSTLKRIGDYAFSECTEYAGTLELPEGLEEISQGAFYNCKSVSGDLIIPDSVTTLGESAFSFCGFANGELVIPEGIETIEGNTFEETKFNKITIPESVKSIGSFAFNGCGYIEGPLTLPSGLTEIGECAFENCRNLSCDLKLPDSLTTIGEWAFHGGGFDGKLTVPANLKTVSIGAFGNCKFTGIEISEGVEVIAERAFTECCFEGDIIIPSTVTSVGEEAFAGIQNIDHMVLLNEKCQTGYLSLSDGNTIVGYEGSTAETYAKEYGSCTFKTYCEYFGHDTEGEWIIEKAASCTEVGLKYRTCKLPSCTKAETEVITATGHSEEIDAAVPPSCTETGLTEGKHCTVCGEITVSQEEVPMTDHSFGDWEVYQAATLGKPGTERKTCASCGHFESRDYDLIASGNCGDNAKWTLNYQGILAFSGEGPIGATNEYLKYNKSIDKIIIEEGITEIKDNAFFGCNVKTAIELPSTLKKIEAYAFRECKEFAGTLTLPEGFEEIGAGAFEGCTAITGDLVIPDSVEQIGENAFYNCGFENGQLTLPEGIEKIEDGTFSETGFSSFNVPSTVTSIGKYAFARCENLEKELIIPENILFIDEYAFQSPSGIETIVVLNENCTIADDAMPEIVTLVGYEGSSAETYSDKFKNDFMTYCEYYDHNYSGDWIIDRDATCTVNGLKHQICSNTACTVHKTEVITASGHSEEILKAVKETCTEPGLTEGKKCSVCKEILIAQEELPATGHDWGEWQIVSEPDCNNIGLKSRICMNSCKEEQSEYIDALPHNYVSYSKVAERATTSADGIEEIYTYCDRCEDPDMAGPTEIRQIPSIATVSLSYSKKNYTGSTIAAPTLTVEDADGTALEKGTDYDVTGLTGKKSVGRYKVTVNFKGKYYGTVDKYFTIVPKAPTTATADLSTASGGYDDVKFSWSKATGASGYTVYYKKSTSSSYTYLTRTTATSVTKKDLSDGIKYYFKVVPYYKSGDTRYASLSYKTANVYTLKKVTTPTVTKSGTKVKVKWTNINGESGYQISKSTKKTGTSIVSTYATTTGISKLVSATKGKTYYYKVRAYKNVKVNGVTKKVYGPWSTVKSYKRK